ncbi:MAG: PAS domain-containing protein [Pedosphaera sp.]|nr:PAS domain-containing protein [Pedosphaera sp.]
MWPTFAFILAASAILLHLWWSACYRGVRKEKLQREQEIARLEEQGKRTAAHGEAQQQALFNSMIEGVLLVDADGRIQLANQALDRLMGSTHEIRGKTIIEAFRLHQLSELIEQVVSRGQVLDFDLELHGTNARSLQVNAAAITDNEGRIDGVILVFHDRSRLKQLEATRKEFVANVSHELRTPLSIIKGYVETLIDGAKDDPTVSGRFLKTILKHTDRLNYLIEDLLTISELESGRSVLNLEQVDVKAVTVQVLEDLQSRADEKQMLLKNDVPIGTVVTADADRLQQVLFNLLDNSIKYGRVGGHAQVSARLLEDKKIEICVRDDGPGIPSEALARVFERFYRVDGARSRKEGGTGLGLSIVKHIVQAHGGEIWAKSDLGQGASFHFTLLPRQS